MAEETTQPEMSQQSQTNSDDGGSNNSSSQTTQDPKIIELETKLQEMTSIAQRALADLQNSKRRNEEEKAGFITFANSTLLIDLLPALDNLHRGLEHSPKSELESSPKVVEWINGIEASIREFETILNQKGLKTIDTTNAKFDPNLHEALMTVEGETDMVIQELEKGYMLSDKVLRRSKVTVGKGLTPSSEHQSSDQNPEVLSN